MKKFLKLSSLALLTLFLATACKKYKEGPKLTLRTVKKRFKGRYSVSRVLVNGQDSTAAFNANYNNQTFRFYWDQDLGQYQVGGDPEMSYWLSKDKEQVVMGPLPGYKKYGPFFGDGSGFRAYDICRLEDKQMTFATTFNSLNYEITFTEI